MAKAEFYMLYIKRKPDVIYETVKEKINLSVDWYRINEELWILYTTSNAEKWYSRLSPYVKEGGNIFISKLDVSSRQGWMDKKFWKWLRREKDTKTQ